MADLDLRRRSIFKAIVTAPIGLLAEQQNLAPRRVPHAFVYDAPGTGRLLVGFTPAGRMEQFFRDIEKRGQYFGAGTPEDKETARAACALRVRRSGRPPVLHRHAGFQKEMAYSRGGCEIILCENPARHDKSRLFVELNRDGIDETNDRERQT